MAKRLAISIVKVEGGAVKSSEISLSESEYLGQGAGDNGAFDAKETFRASPRPLRIVVGDDAPAVVYVGKSGAAYRCRHWHNRNSDVTAMGKAGLLRKPRRMAEGLTETEAFDLERATIALHGPLEPERFSI